MSTHVSTSDNFRYPLLHEVHSVVRIPVQTAHNAEHGSQFTSSVLSTSTYPSTHSQIPPTGDASVSRHSLQPSASPFEHVAHVKWQDCQSKTSTPSLASYLRPGQLQPPAAEKTAFVSIHVSQPEGSRQTRQLATQGWQFTPSISSAL